jgi:hypothetical protein
MCEGPHERPVAVGLVGTEPLPLEVGDGWVFVEASQFLSERISHVRKDVPDALVQLQPALDRYLVSVRNAQPDPKVSVCTRVVHDQAKPRGNRDAQLNPRRGNAKAVPVPVVREVVAARHRAIRRRKGETGLVDQQCEPKAADDRSEHGNVLKGLDMVAYRAFFGDTEYPVGHTHPLSNLVPDGLCVPANPLPSLWSE